MTLRSWSLSTVLYCTVLYCTMCVPSTTWTGGKPQRHMVGSLKMNTTLEYSTRVVQEGDHRCKKSTLNDLAYLTPLRIPLMNPVIETRPRSRLPVCRWCPTPFYIEDWTHCSIYNVLCTVVYCMTAKIDFTESKKSA